MAHKVTHGMASAKARRVQLTGSQLKSKFKSDYTINGLIPPNNDFNKMRITESATYSLKVGDNWQFHLGRFNELDEVGYEISTDGKTIDFQQPEKIRELFYSGYMLRKYAFPFDVFVCLEDFNWIVFNSDDLNEFLAANMRVRILDTGRIKVDVYNGDRFLAIFTLEYRSETHKRSFVFGAHGGGAGKRLRKILINNCDYSILGLGKDSIK